MLLRNIFNTGVFENPYIDVQHTIETVGNPEFMREGFEAQLKSVVMLKNRYDVLPADQGLKVYLPQRYIPASRDWFGNETPERWEYLLSPEVASEYFTVVDDPDEADMAIVSIESPKGGNGFSRSDLEAGGNGYVPVSLQYGEYRAENAREESIAGGSPFEDFTNRSYRGKTTAATNSYDLQMVTETRERMGNKPVIVTIRVSNPMVFSEFEESADAILIHSGVQDQALLELISGNEEPYGLLPFQMPSGMQTVEEQFEDVPRDMNVHMDTEGNLYNFAFGLNWNGVIEDSRVEKYW